MYEAVCILQIHVPISYCVSLIMVTITRHIFINIFQTECFSAVKFAMGYEKYEISSDSKIAKSLGKKKRRKKKKKKKDRTGLL